MTFRKLIIFLVLLTIFLGFLGFWYYQRNIFSRKVLQLEILGPGEAELGEEVEYIVKYKNMGNVRLEEARFVFEFPKFSYTQENKLRLEKTLEDIYPGEEKSVSLKGRFLGKEGEVKIAKAWLSFRPQNISARYESATTHTAKISFVPLAFEIDIPSKIESGKEFRFRVNYFSNVSFPLSDLRIKIDYPPDFTFGDSKPKALGENEWEIGILNKTAGGRIEVTGRISGEIGRGKIFRATLGSWQEGEFVVLKEAMRGIELERPLLLITRQINGNPQYTANPGDFLHYEIFFKNLEEEPKLNLFLVAKLEGSAFDFQSLRAEKGKFQAGDNSIIWDSRDIPELQFLDSQEEGKVEFWIELKKEWQISSERDKNPVIQTSILLGPLREDFVTKVNSKLEVVQQGYFSDDVFGNSGPLPPQVDRQTTYTVFWKVKNFYNDLRNVKVKATLPPWVRLTGEIFPKEAKFTFDSQSREIIWEIGDLAAGKGVFAEPLGIAFQIAFTPSFSQRGQAPTLVGPATVIGDDIWTEDSIEASAKTLDTTLPDDPNGENQGGIVQ